MVNINIISKLGAPNKACHIHTTSSMIVVCIDHYMHSGNFFIFNGCHPSCLTFRESRVHLHDEHAFVGCHKK